MASRAIVVDVSAGDPTLPKVDLVKVDLFTKATYAWASDNLSLGPTGVWAPAAGSVAFTAPAGQELTTVDSGGSRALRTDGVNDQASITGLAVTQPCTIVLVARLTTTAPSGVQTILGRAAGNAFNFMTNSVNTRWQFTGEKTFFASTEATPDTNWHVFILAYNGANSTFQIDGLSASGDAGALSMTQLRLGASGSLNTAAEYKRLEIAPGAATAAERDAIVAKAKAHYGF